MIEHFLHIKQKKAATGLWAKKANYPWSDNKTCHYAIVCGGIRANYQLSLEHEKMWDSRHLPCLENPSFFFLEVDLTILLSPQQSVIIVGNWTYTLLQKKCTLISSSSPGDLRSLTLTLAWSYRVCQLFPTFVGIAHYWSEIMGSCERIQANDIGQCINARSFSL